MGAQRGGPTGVLPHHAGVEGERRAPVLKTERIFSGSYDVLFFLHCNLLLEELFLRNIKL